MPGRIRYVPPAPLHDNLKVMEEEQQAQVVLETADPSDEKSEIRPLDPHPAETQQPQPEHEEGETETFESLDRVAPLPWPRGYSEAFTAENFTYTEVTVNDDEEDDNASEGSSGSSSSEDAFIEVNHDDESVVSTLTLETALRSSKGSRKKKKKKKESKSKKTKKKKPLLSEDMIVEEEEGSRGEASDRTDRTGLTQNSAKTAKSKKAKSSKGCEDDKSTRSNASVDEILEVSLRSKRLPALTNLDTISTQPTSTKTTDAVAGTSSGSLIQLRAQKESKRAPEADTASEVAPPIPKKTDHSVEFFPADESIVVYKVESQKPAPVDTAEVSIPISDEASVKIVAVKDTPDPEQTKDTPKAKRQSNPFNDSATPKSSPQSSPSSMVEPGSKKLSEAPSATQKFTTNAKPTDTSKIPLQAPKAASVAEAAAPSDQKPASTVSLKAPPTKPASTSTLKADTEKAIKPASTNRMQAPTSPMSSPKSVLKPKEDQKVHAVPPSPRKQVPPDRQSNAVPPSPRKQAPNQSNAPPKKPPASSATKPISASGSLPRKPNGSQQEKSLTGTVARLPVTSTHSEGIARSTTGTSNRLSSVATTPGAYHVQGSKMHLATAHSTDRDDFSITDTSVASKQGKKKKEKQQQVPQSPASTKNLVIAAELSDDVEAKIEQEVRRRIMASAVHADLVSVASEPSTTKPPAIVTIEKPIATVAELKELHKHKGVKEKLFGDARQMVDIAASPESIRKRDYLQWIVKRNPATNQWIASVTTNQKAMEEGDNIEMEMSKVSYAAQTQQEAYETGLSNATPMMQRFDDNPICHCCKSKFAMFRRPTNCRNCGVCICSSCTASWNSKMLPDTYLKKNEKSTVTGKWSYPKER
jgi:FYVE zinc finger